MAVTKPKPIPLLPSSVGVQIAQFNGYHLVGRPSAAPLKRLPHCDPQRRRFLERLIGRWVELPQLLHDYIGRTGVEPNPPVGPQHIWRDRHQDWNMPLPFAPHKRTSGVNVLVLIDTCVRLMREGRLLVRSATPDPAFPASVLPLDWGDRKQSAAGEDFLYRREAVPGVSNRLHWPGDASGVTLGSGYDMKLREEEEIENHMLQLGLPADISSKIAEGAGLEGAKARDFCVKHKDVVYISAEQEIELMRMVLPTYEKRMNNALSVSIKSILFQSEIDALISFTYNRGSLKNTKLADYINSGNLDLAEDGFNQFRPGRDINRRPAEIALFTQGRYR